MLRHKGKIITIALAALAFCAFATAPHRADIAILTHRQGDLAPERVEAVVDVGSLAVSVLVTWSRHLPY